MEAKHTCSTISKVKKENTTNIPHSSLEVGHPHMKEIDPLLQRLFKYISKNCRASLHQQPMRTMKIELHYIGNRKARGV